MIVQPGDTLLVCCAERLTNDQAAHLRTAILERLPDLADVVLLPAIQVAAYRGVTVADVTTPVEPEPDQPATPDTPEPDPTE